ncbi:MAG: BREX-2 system phosphatase PglZ [Kineosporiaceae bacterium]|nr:BREX-2 system phosphatase PglZ [Kineosporiaceae bacterium]
MTATSAGTAAAATPVSTAMVLAIVDEARSDRYRYDRGVIGVRGMPDRAVAADLDHRGQAVRIRPAESALAAREALAEREGADWLVIVTDRDDDDLGAGVLAHLIWQRLRSPDPWEAVRNRFSANGIDPALTTLPHSRDLATALLAATPSSGWRAAPAGLLTRSHALGSVAAAHLSFAGDGADAITVLRWSTAPDSVTAVGALRHDIGERLADETLRWIAQRAGAAAEPVLALLAQGRLGDVVPMGVVLHLLTTVGAQGPAALHQAELTRARLEREWGEGAGPPVAALTALGQAADALIADLVHDRRAEALVARLLTRAESLLAGAQGTDLARSSPLLAAGLTARLARLADALQRASSDPQESARADVESAWVAVREHRFAQTDGRYPAAEAAVRVIRWLATPALPAPAKPDAALGFLARAHLDVGGWADAAINRVIVGVDDPEFAAALQQVATAARDRRRTEERDFAAALAAVTALDASDEGVPSDAGTVWYLEHVVPRLVIPLARRAPVLLLVLDGMSAANATEIMADATDRLGWVEAALPGTDAQRRAAALAVLPSLTRFSRTSLLCGRLIDGAQAAERSGYADLTSQVGSIRASLLHKRVVDTTAPGWSISHDLGAAVDNRETHLVTIVLNTVDDALDRSDPGGIVWTAGAVRHLEPILARAAAAGRTVVITSDHGHVVERRDGAQRSRPPITSGRSRAASEPIDDGEVLVQGARVLTDDHRAVLAVDDTLRYGPLKAGYHGGASAAEVVVPVAVLVREEADYPQHLVLLPPQQPTWWVTSSAHRAAAGLNLEASFTGSARVTRRAPRREDSEHTLFDLEPADTTPESDTPSATLGQVVVASAAYRGQRKVAGRLVVSDDQVAALVDALAGAGSDRLPAALAAQALGLAQTRLRGALTQVQQLLNVEGYAVLVVEPVTGQVILDMALLREQFEVRV